MKTLFTLLLVLTTVVVNAQCDDPALCDTLHLGPPAPVEVGEYSIKLVENQPVISWTTLSEHNNAFFSVSRSDDGGNYYDVIGFINGFGTTLDAQDYEYTDTYPRLKGRVYYRLHQVDNDGTTTLICTLTWNFDESVDVSGTLVPGILESIQYYDLNGKLTEKESPTVKIVVVKTNKTSFSKLTY